MDLIKLNELIEKGVKKRVVDGVTYGIEIFSKSAISGSVQAHHIKIENLTFKVNIEGYLANICLMQKKLLTYSTQLEINGDNVEQAIVDLFIEHGLVNGQAYR